MKKLIVLCSFMLLSIAAVHAQGNGNAWGQGNGNPANSGSNGWAWGQGGGYNALVNYLENGGQVPHVVALAAIFKARQWGQQNFGLNYGQMVARYAQGTLTVTYITTAPPALIFRVGYGGIDIQVIIDSI